MFTMMKEWVKVLTFCSVCVLFMGSTFHLKGEEEKNPESLQEDLSHHDAVRPVSHVIVQGLDKVTGRILTLETLVGKEIKFGRLKIKVHRCFKTPPENVPEAIAELDIYETLTDSREDVLIFKGNMYASSPSVAALDHPVYDVWIKDCF